MTTDRDATTRYVAPTTPEQALMAGVWAKVLGVPRVGVTDNFFDLGGDSRRALELIVGAARKGVKIDLRQLFARPTIASLTSADGTPSMYLLDPFRDWELTPVQREIYRWRAATGCWQPHPHPISLPPSVSLDRLETALAMLAERHEILQGRLDEGAGRPRLRFLDHGPGRVPLLRTSQALVPATISGLGERPAGERPPMSVLWLDDPAGSPAAMLLFDDVLLDVRSRDLLVADLERCYLAAGGIVAAAWPAPAPFSAWVRQFPERIADVSDETTYWVNQGGRRPPEQGQVEPDDRSTEVYATRLPQHETDCLLRTLPDSRRIDPTEVIATAVATALSVAAVAGPMDIEADGRPWRRGDEQFDESAGQFGVTFPVCAVLDPSWAPQRRLATMQEQLRGVPSYGAGAGLLREFSPDPGVRAALANRLPARILIRTAGLTLPRMTGRLFSSTGSAATLTRTYPVEVMAVSEPAGLRLDWRFAAGADRTVVRQLAELTTAAVGPLLDAVVRAPVGAAATDYPLSRLAARGRVSGLRRT